MANTSTLDDLADAADLAVRERDEAISARRCYLCGCPHGGFHTDDCLDALDAVRSRAYRASTAHFGALRETSFEELRRVEAAAYSRRASDNAYSNLKAASEHLHVLEEVGPDLRLESEWLHAQAMEERHGMIWDAYLDKRAALTEAKKARRLKRIAVTDGRVRTGYKMVDGVRIPIVEATR